MKHATTLGNVRQLLPESVQDLAVLLGDEDTLRVVTALGGINLRVPDGSQPATAAKLAEQLGSRRLAERLIHFFAGEALYFPHCHAARQALRNLEIHREADTTLREGRRLSHAVDGMARRHGLSARRVWAILKQPAPVLEGGQP